MLYDSKIASYYFTTNGLLRFRIITMLSFRVTYESQRLKQTNKLIISVELSRLWWTESVCRCVCVGQTALCGV